MIFSNIYIQTYELRIPAGEEEPSRKKKIRKLDFANPLSAKFETFEIVEKAEKLKFLEIAA